MLNECVGPRRIHEQFRKVGFQCPSDRAGGPGWGSRGGGGEQDKPDKGKFLVVVTDSIRGNGYVKIHSAPGIFLL